MSGYIIGLLIGLVCGVIATFLIRHNSKKTIGTIRVDQSDPDDVPYLFLELDDDVNALKKQKCVTFRVNVQNYISQK